MCEGYIYIMERKGNVVGYGKILVALVRHGVVFVLFAEWVLALSERL